MLGDDRPGRVVSQHQVAIQRVVVGIGEVRLYSFKIRCDHELCHPEVKILTGVALLILVFTSSLSRIRNESEFACDIG